MQLFLFVEVEEIVVWKLKVVGRDRLDEPVMSKIWKRWKEKTLPRF